MPLQTKLKYLFSAHFDDNTSFLQKDDDSSELDPKRTSYYDLLELVKEGKKIILFELLSATGSYAVDLLTGKFWVRWQIFILEPTVTPLPEGGNFELVYFRDCTATLNLYANGEKTSSLTHKYRFGWNYKLGDKTWTQCMVIE